MVVNLGFQRQLHHPFVPHAGHQHSTLVGDVKTRPAICPQLHVQIPYACSGFNFVHV